ncbi:uncharacterized protein LOC131956272 isoform X2 [Physella acuta]|nr:uncharacterized protein LOC131956272 isoform X2 [Physella acuta]XP_059176705.1 uncharacterized protein LOC131956272 isoform X2 [Physella acuta]XP_059176706.1 uncharacterized protein LOC131956272 isoform X2 [Physella acuta]
MLCQMGDELLQIPQKKRKMYETTVYTESWQNAYDTDMDSGKISGKHFIHFPHLDSDSIFHTEDWQPSGSSLFTPLTEDLMVNTRNIEQFSYMRGQFFVSGVDGTYSKTINGEVLHLWRYCSQRKKLFISRSFLFKNTQDFRHIQEILKRL